MTGDIEAKAERYLLKQKADLTADVLIAPHHGSRSSSTRSFVKAVSPQHVLFPVGFYNRYGFPKGNIVKRYERSGAQWLDTANSGAISFTLNRRALSMSSYRQTHRHYWHALALPHPVARQG